MQRKIFVTAIVMAIGAFFAAARLPAAEKDDGGWRLLFNGKDLSGWQNASGGKPKWSCEDGAMVRRLGSGDIWTNERFGNFILDLEFKTEGNSGIFIRTDNPKDNVQTGIEIQVMTAAKNRKPSKHSCGAVYDSLAPTKDVVKDHEWNHAVITAVDNRVSVELNGEKIIDMDLNRWETPAKNPDGTKNKFHTALKDFKREGHIGLQDHLANVAYRNVKIKVLDQPVGK